MIQTVVFVVAFVLLGLTVVGLAMRSGRRKKPVGAGPSRGERRATLTLTALLTLGLGVAIPAVILVTNSQSKAENAPGGVELTAAQADGRQQFAHNCSMCHTLRASNAVGRVGPNLDALRPPAALTLDAIEKGRAQGNGQMPAGLLSGQEAKDVAEYIAAVAGRD